MRPKCHDCKVTIECVDDKLYQCPKCRAEWSEDDICSSCGDWADSGSCFTCKMD